MDKVPNTIESSEKDLEKAGPHASVACLECPDIEPTVIKETDRTSADPVFVVERVVNGSICTVKSSRSSFTCETEEIPKQPVIESSVPKQNSPITQSPESGVEIVKEITVACTDKSGKNCLKSFINKFLIQQNYLYSAK